MGIFDAIFGKRGREPETPAELFAALQDAQRRGDARAFEALCRAHTDAIVAAFPGWQKPAAELMTSREAIDAYVQVLGTAAQFLDRALGRPECWALVTAGNPFERWETAHAAIVECVKALEHERAIELARALVTELEALTGSGKDEPEELARGSLGQLLRQVGRVDEAVPHLAWTLERCEARGDLEGIGIYLKQLHEADRDRGRVSTWLPRLAAHAELVGAHDDAAWYRQVHGRYPQGEPLLRQVVIIGTHRFELDQQIPFEVGQPADVVFERNRETLGAARAWTTRGEELGGQGELERAIECFAKAAAIDPHDPQCRYLEAFTEMLCDRPARALPLYDEVERLAPGWFHASTWQSLARRQLAGEITHDAVKLVDLLEDGGLAPAELLEAASRAILRWPRMPELHLYRGYALADLGRDAKPAWLAGLEVADAVPSTKSRLLLALGRLGDVLEVEGANAMALAAARLQLLAGRDAPTSARE